MVLSKQYNKKLINILKKNILVNNEDNIITNIPIGRFIGKNIILILKENIFEKHATIVNQYFIKAKSWHGPFCIQLYKVYNCFIEAPNLIKYMDKVKIN